MRQYKRWTEQRGAGPAGGRGGPQPNFEDLFGNAAGGGGAGVPGDLFGDLFGSRFGGTSGRRRGPPNGADLESEITIDLPTAIRGGEMSFRIAGADEPVTIRIPPGADEGSRLRVPGHGSAAPRGGKPGDLLLNIHVEPHPFFRREGNDLHLDLPITVGEAFHGAKVRVPTPGGFVSLKVPPHAQSGQVFRLRSKGVVKKGVPPGDLYVHFLVHLPTDETPEVQAAVDTLEKATPPDPRAKIVL
jgi:curved DNA-binding protein